MLNRPCRSFPAPSFSVALAVIVSSIAVVGCGNDKLSDDPYGFIDLAPYYYDGSTASNPSSGLPREIAPTKGWVNGKRAEYYDFGLVGFTKKRTDTKLPDYASVPPIYFFFDSSGQPLFSKPVYETRTGLWHMRGGKNVLNPNPAPKAPRNVPYSVRVREYLNDPTRGVPDYQRPIVDRLQSNSDYSGLWEIWEVVAPEGYEPDAIKSLDTLQKGIDDGSFQWRRTQRVINCPVIDDRQFVTPTALQYGIPRPRIEVWYRTKQGSCYLADGWYALADGNDKLITANHDSRRLNMFDVISYTIGNDEGARTTVVAPISKLYTPMVTVANQDPARGAISIRYPGDFISDAQPKLSPADAPGYRPLRWLWDLKVPQDPPYVAASYKSVEQMDPANLANRLDGNSPYVRNFPLVGVATSCKDDSECAGVKANPGITLTCNKTPNAELATTDAASPDAAAAAMLQRDGGPRCDVPAVRFGEFCAPGVARCLLNVVGSGVAEEEAGNAVDLKIGPSAEKGGGWGYTCQPMGTGFCMFRCDVDVTGTVSKAGTAPIVDITYVGPNGTMKKDKGEMATDTRCGSIPGYKCLNPAPTSPAVPSRMRVCLRQCDTAKPDSYNDVFCQVPVNVTINEKVAGNIQKGMACSTRGIQSAAGCQWDPAFVPLDTKTNFVPAP